MRNRIEEIKAKGFDLIQGNRDAADFTEGATGYTPIDYSKIKLSGITDGTRCPQVPIECRCEPKADGNYTCVMAASILAKVERDRIMYQMDKLYPEYGYAKHKGYPTKAHKEVCYKIGPSPIQRLSFKY